jgi:hypothetical protein
MTMASVCTAADRSGTQATPTARALWRRIIDRIAAAHMRRIERGIARVAPSSNNQAPLSTNQGGIKARGGRSRHCPRNQTGDRDMAMQSIHGTFPARAGRAVQETARKPLIRRIIDALMEAQARRAEREVAQFLQTRAWSDETEREIERRFIRRGFSGE